MPGCSGMGTDIYGGRESEYLEMGSEDCGGRPTRGGMNPAVPGGSARGRPSSRERSTPSPLPRRWLARGPEATDESRARREAERHFGTRTFDARWPKRHFGLAIPRTRHCKLKFVLDVMSAPACKLKSVLGALASMVGKPESVSGRRARVWGKPKSVSGAMASRGSSRKFPSGGRASRMGKWKPGLGAPARRAQKRGPAHSRCSPRMRRPCRTRTGFYSYQGFHPWLV